MPGNAAPDQAGAAVRLVIRRKKKHEYKTFRLQKGTRIP